jgi:GNAT superfamily N-acetyltransferase
MGLSEDEVLQAIDQTTKAAKAKGLRVWPSFPSEAPMVLWPYGDDVDEFLATALDCGSRILYLDAASDASGSPAGLLIGFAVDGILHAMGVGVDPSGVPVGRPVQTVEFADDDDDDDDFSGWDYSYGELPSPLKAVVDLVVEDSQYDGWNSDTDVLSRHAGHLPSGDYERVKDAANSRFRALHGRRLDTEAERIAPRIVAHPDFDPLEMPQWNSLVTAFVVEHAGVEDPRLLRRIAGEVLRTARDRGLYVAAESALAEEARRILADLPAVRRDRIGFARGTKLEDLVEDLITTQTGHRRKLMARLIDRVEEEYYGRARNQRYATAARALIRRGAAKAATSRALGISTAVIDRLLLEYPDDVDLAPNDPIVTTLAPELAP